MEICACFFHSSLLFAERLDARLLAPLKVPDSLCDILVRRPRLSSMIDLKHLLILSEKNGYKAIKKLTPLAESRLGNFSLSWSMNC